MPVRPISLAKVMIKASEHDIDTDQNRGRLGHRLAYLGEQAGQAAARGARGWAGKDRLVRHAVGLAGRTRSPWRDDPARAGRAREGAATIDDPRDRGNGGSRPRAAGNASHRSAAGHPVGHPAGQELGEPGAAAQGRVAGHATAGAHREGAGHSAGSSADPGEAEPGLTGTRSASGRRRVFSSLRNRNYRLFATGQVVSNTGTWMQRVAQDWLVLELTHGSGTALGVATGLQFLPLLLFGLWGGAIADRYPKRRILMVTQATMGALALILGILTITGVVQIWHVYALAFALGLITVVDNPTRQTFAVEMVGRANMPNAIALNSATFNLARIVGPAVAGLVISALGTPIAFMINAASFGAVLTGLKLMRTSELHPAEPAPRAKGQIRDALRYVLHRPSLCALMVIVFFVATFGMNFQVTTALMSREVFHTGAGAFGLAGAVFAAGALCGALLAARRRRPGVRLLLVSASAFGLLEVLTGLMPTFWSFLAMLVPTGLALLTFSTAANSATQLETSPEMRGRVMGLYLLVFLGGTPLGSPLVGWLAEQFGARTSLMAGGAISAIAAVLVAAVLARSQSLRVRDFLKPRELLRIVT